LTASKLTDFWDGESRNVDDKLKRLLQNSTLILPRLQPGVSALLKAETVSTVYMEILRTSAQRRKPLKRLQKFNVPL